MSSFLLVIGRPTFYW